jgi:hypothetical protein
MAIEDPLMASGVLAHLEQRGSSAIQMSGLVVSLRTKKSKLRSTPEADSDSYMACSRAATRAGSSL